MRGVPPVTLPEAAKHKLLALQFARGTAEDAARAASTRLQQLPRDADARMRDALAAEQGKQQQRFGSLNQLLSRLQQGLSELRPGTALQSAEPVELTLKPGEKLADVIQATRTEIKATRDRLAAVKAAKLPLADMKECAELFVAQNLNAARPAINFVGDQLKVTPRGDMFAAADVLALIAWACPEQLYRAIAREIDRQPARPDSLSATERVRLANELKARLLELERNEESLIERAEREGLTIDRRADADPRAVLNLVVVDAKAAAQATAA